MNLRHPRPRPLPWLAAALAYYLAATFGHDGVSAMYTAVFKVFGRQAMEAFLGIGSVVLLAAAALGLWAARRAGKRLDAPTAVAGTVTAVLIVLANQLLVCTNVENVHFPQYALLALLLRKVFRGEFFILCLCTLGGMFDELMQYVMYPQYTKYLDFNDFILNLLGAAAGLVLARVFVRRGGLMDKGIEARVRRWAAAAAGGIAVLVAVGAALGRIVAYVPVDNPESAFAPAMGKTAFVLSFVDTQGALALTDFGRQYYILDPLQGLVALAGLLLLYFFLLRRDSTASA